MPDWICEYCGGVNPGDIYTCLHCGHPKTHLSAKLPRLQETIHLVKDKIARPAGIDLSNEVILVDASKWNGSINYSILRTKAYGILLRGLLGVARDSSYTTNRSGAMEDSFPYGMYAAPVISPGQSYTAQAEAVKNVLLEQPYDIPLALDLEKTYFSTPQETANWCYGYASEVRSKTGISRGLIYSRKSWWDYWVPPGNQTFWQFWEAWPAHWTTASVPLVMRDWNGLYRLHQFSGDNNGLASEYGFSGGDPDIDLDRFNGTPTEYNAWLENINPEPEPTVTLKPGVNIRTLPVVAPTTDWANTDKIITVPLEEVIYDAEGYPWGKIPAWVRLDLFGWPKR